MSKIILLMLIGFAEGLVVGTALVAFLILLDIVPRLSQLTGTYGHCKVYEFLVIAGAVAGSLVVPLNLMVPVPIFIIVIAGLFMGIFVGLLAAALTEVLNVIPIISRRLGMDRKIYLLLMALILGKITGSLLYWFIKGLR